MKVNDKIYVAGHTGLVGSAIVRELQSRGYSNLLTRTHEELDLINQNQVSNFFHKEKPDFVILAAATVGGILANSSYPADFIYQNIMIEANVIHSAYKYKVKRLLFLGSTCIYPRGIKQPMAESSLLSDALEPTNEPYAISKIAGIKLCESYNRQYGRDYRSVMPTNLYGPGDNYHPLNSHVIPGLIRRFHEAKINNHSEVVAWGSGEPMREFLYVDDMAEASIFIMNLSRSDHEKVVDPMLSHINVGSGEDISINELTCIVAEITGYSGEIIWDVTKADGTLKKLMDVSKLNELGWSYKVKLREGLSLAYADYLNGHRD